ncbi:hypothetical protein SteCoe_27526 [Stentor coeruleus]|uniref:PHD-type domain-containing protein n=1 Tax=Stentor coeruleus TaxID=5963 RepID=A0A1R2BAB0_9CILI|nr:hypothetical protein SteCoe_27526 [Stentor coeruleus]
MSFSASTPSTQNSESGSFSICDMDVVYSPMIFDESKLRKKFEETKRYKNRTNNMKSAAKNQAESICCICGTSDLLISCTKVGCNNSYHLNCLIIYYPSLSKEEKICPEHTFKNLKEISRLLFLSNKFNSDKQLKNIAKSLQKPKTHFDILGKLFWFGVSQQYFPNVTLATPNFSHNETNKVESASTNTWIEQKIDKIKSKLASTTQTVTEIITPIQQAYQKTHKKLKTLDYPPDPLYIPMNLKKKYIKNYEKIQLSSYFYEKKDYHNFISEEKIICAVCDEGESTEDNLIVICHDCQVPVHSNCYNIKSIPEIEWLCNYCTAKAEAKDNKSGQCELCPITGGALKKIKGNIWAHVTCSRSLQENPGSDTELDVKKIDKEKFKLKCFECGLKVGACIQCSYGRCATSFHVECRKDLLDKYTDGRSMKFCNALCPGHKASKLSRIIKENEEYTREFLAGFGNTLWEKMTPAKPVLSEKRKPREKKKKAELKKKIILHVTEDKVLVKLYINNKLARVMKYSRSLDKAAVKKVEKQIKDQSVPDEKLDSLLVKGKRDKKNPEIAILKTNKGDFTIKMKVPHVLLDDLPMKKVLKHT